MFGQAGIAGGVPNFFRTNSGKLVKQKDWDEWQKVEFEQLDQYWSLVSIYV